MPRGGLGTYHAVVLLQGLALPRRAAEAAGAGGGTGDVRPPVLFQLDKRPRERRNEGRARGCHQGSVSLGLGRGQALLWGASAHNHFKGVGQGTGWVPSRKP